MAGTSPAMTNRVFGAFDSSVMLALVAGIPDSLTPENAN
jgi:hypothetical protein